MEIKNKKTLLVLGDDAVGIGAVDAGVKSVFGYPGTPSTEVFECAEHLINELNDGRVAQWAPNEKVAYEMALGCSYSGQRTIVTMKHVGLNVAMDPFVNSALTGVNGGLVVLVADDPNMHSSQNEQDSRYLADFCNIPCLEPSTPQEAYNLTIEAFELSEKLKLPVLLRLVTRLAHSRAIINRKKTLPPISLGIPSKEETLDWVLVPGISRNKYNKLRENLPILQKSVVKYNKLKLGDRIGIVVSGMGRAHFQQLTLEYPKLNEFTRLDVQAYPLKHEVIQEMLSFCDIIYFFEEDYPYIEDQFLSRTKSTKIYGRRNRTIPIAGELTPLEILSVLRITPPESLEPVDIELPLRPPRLCKGCGHADAFNAIKAAFIEMNHPDFRIFGDIGCYTLGVHKPYECIHTTVEMGASASMALGAALSGYEPSVGLLGDSTFYHSGLPTLVAMTKTKVNVNLIIMDNRTTAMTGQQPTIKIDNIASIAKGAGFDDSHITELIPLPKYHDENVEKLKKVFSRKEPDVIIFKRDCIQAARKGLIK